MLYLHPQNNKAMKNLLLFLLLITGFLSFFACNKADDDTPQLNRIFTLKIEETATFDDPELALTADSIVSDSRCPNGAVCVWEGLVEVTFTFTTDDTDYSVNLTLHADNPQKAETRIAGYTLRLVTVNPYPDIDHPISPEEYILSLVIEN